MLQTIRDRASGWIAYIIIGLLIIPFALWGINSYFEGGGTQDIARVGDSPISQQEFQQAYDQQRQRMQSLIGADYNPSPAEETRLKYQALQQLIDEKVLFQVARREGLRVGDEQLWQAIAASGAFQQDGKFNAELYKGWLRSRGYTVTGFEESLRSDLAAEQLQEGISGSAFVTAAELDKVIALLNQKRDIQYLGLPLARHLAAATVEDTAVESYFQANQARFMEPERIRLQYLELKLEQMAEGVTVSDEELQKAYEEQMNTFRQPEERNASHILFKATDPANAEELEKLRGRAREIHQAIASGAKTFQQAMDESRATEGVEVGDLGTITKGMMDPAFESALYGLKAVGDVSEPVQTSFGIHLVRLDGITPERIKPFAEARDDLMRQARLRKAEKPYEEIGQQLTDLSYVHRDNLALVAEKLGLTLNESAWFTAQGGEGIAAFPRVVEAAFSDNVLKQKANSGPLEVEPNHVLVVRLLDHQAAKPKPLEQVRDEVVDQLRKQQAEAALNKEAEALLGRVKQGETLQNLATEVGGEVKSPGLLGRTDTGADPGLLREAFQLLPPAADKPAIGLAKLGNGDTAILVVNRVEPGDPAGFPEPDRGALAQRLSGQRGGQQLMGFKEGMRKQADVVTQADKL